MTLLRLRFYSLSLIARDFLFCPLRACVEIKVTDSQTGDGERHGSIQSRSSGHDIRGSMGAPSCPRRVPAPQGCNQGPSGLSFGSSPTRGPCR